MERIRGGGHAGGCIAYNVFQCVFGAIVFGEICKYVYNKLKNKYIAVIVLIFYSAAPMWWTYMQALIKDSLCFIVFAWFILELVKVYFSESGRMGSAKMIIAGVLTALLRNGMSLIIIPAVFVLLFAVKDKRKIFILMTGIIILIVSFNYFPKNILGLKPGNQVEDKSIPLQQIARTVTFFEEEFTDEDKEIINYIVKYDGIPERYNPETSDPIKNHFGNPTKEEWRNFWHLWIRKFKQHPRTYVEAFLNNIYGYTDPLYFYYGMGSYPLYNKGALGNNDENVIYSEYIFDDDFRSAYSEMIYIWNKIPLLSFVVNPACYTWMLIFLLGLLIRRRQWKVLTLYSAPILIIAMCCLSPVNGLLRYMLPVMATVPVYIMIGIFFYFENTSHEKLV